MKWLDIASRLAKSTDTRNRVFDDPSFLPRLVDAVKAAAGSPPASTPSSPPPLPPSLSNTSNSNNSSCSNSNNNNNNNNSDSNNSCGSGEGNTRQECRDVDSSGMDDADDPVFDAPPRASPEAARALCQAFTFLRDSCAGCPANNEALRETGLADTALKFAIDQAPFACGSSSAASPIANADNDTTTSSSSNSSVGGAREANGGQTTTTPTVTTVAAAATTTTTTTTATATTATASFDSAEPVNMLEVFQTSGLPQAAPPPPLLHSTAAPGLQKEASPAGGACHVRLAVRAAVQFACNYCVGSQENQALLWKEWFPRGLMELANGLKTDRRLLSPSIALIHICCLAERGAVAKNNRGGNGRAEAEGGGGGLNRLRRLTADKAFCCLLMKIVPHNSAAAPVQVGPGSTTGNSSSSSSSSSSGSGSGSGNNSSSKISSAKDAAVAAAADPSDDPAAEWLYLLFCRFVQEGLVGNVYDNVGIRGGGRPAAEGGAADATTVPITSTDGGGGGGGPVLSGDGGEGGDRGRNGEEDFFFPVTPEQLIVLNLAEVAAGDEALTGGERPSAQQRHACDALLSWLAGLLAAMPLDQSLRPRTGTATEGPAVEATAAEAEARSETPLSEGEGERGEGGSRHRHRQGHGEVVVDGETEQTRRGMREEARSAVLRALSALLAGCADDTRLSAAAAATGAGARAGAGRAEAEVEPEAAATVEAAAEIAREVGISSSGRDEVAAEAACASAANCGGSTVDARACELAPPQPPTARPQARLVPLCLRLLSGCGGSAEPKAGVGASRGSPAVPVAAPAAPAAAAATTPQAAQEGDPANYGVGPAGVPAGRKVELLKVIGNACFRCRPSQDLVRDVGALPLVLNHCAVDGANPLLREYALLAVRNLCEGNAANQASIAALQPQGCTPGMDEALADMGLEGHVDVKGKFRVGPRPPPPPPRPAA